jgi:hypothetical protein
VTAFRSIIQRTRFQPALLPVELPLHRGGVRLTPTALSASLSLVAQALSRDGRLLEINIPGVGEDPAHGVVEGVDVPAEALQGRLGHRPHPVERGVERPAGDIRRRGGPWRPGEAEPGYRLGRSAS